MGFQSSNYDCYGNTLATRSEKAATAYVEGIDLYLSGAFGQEEKMKEALAADEGFALAHAALARFEQFRGNMPAAAEGAKRARALAAGTSRREQQHIDIICDAIEGKPAEAYAKTKEHVQDFPTDAFVVGQSSGVYSLVGFSGDVNRNQEQLALLEPLAPAYGDDWWYLCNLAFAENELFLHDRAREHAEESLELMWRNGHAAHTVAHIRFETGDTTGGAAFLEDWRQGYDRRSQLHGHLAWHHALFELLQGNTGAVDAIYREHISPGSSSSAALGLIADAASLLWRRSLGGEELDGYWAEVRDFAANAFQRPGIMFADVHCALAYAASGDETRLEELITRLTERAEQGKIAGGEIVPLLCRAAGAFARGEFDQVIAILEPRQHEVVRIGGSHAQREVFEDTLLEAYFRAGRFADAEALLTERVERRITPRDVAWLDRVREAAAAVA